jgi:predicted metal-binding protein
LSEQRKVAVGSGELNSKVAVVEFVRAGGCAVTTVVGGVRSTFHV